MKKSFLIAGLVACIGVTNSYADIVISQTDDNPDTVITVARAAKVGTRTTPTGISATTATTQGPNSSDNRVETAVQYRCPNGCIVELHGSQDGTNTGITMEYSYCVNGNTGAYCGTPSVEIVNMGSTVNYKPNGGRPNNGNNNDVPVNYKPDGRPNAGAADTWDGNMVNGGKKPR